MKKILVPTDFSAGAEAAYPVAQKIASAFGSKIDFIHVIPTGKYLHESIRKMGVPIDMDKELFPKIIEEAEHQLQKAMSTWILEENHGEFAVKIDRSSYDTIQKHASEGGYDLVVMGSRGKDRSSLFRGNTTEKVIRLSSVPVFSVDESVNEQNLKHILVPTDSSDISLAAFPLAVKMAGTFGSEITLFHVLELYGTMSESLPRDPGKEEMVSIYEAIIESLNAYLLDAGLSEIQIRRGEDPYRDEVIYSVNGETKTIPLHCKVVKGISAHYEIESYAQEEYDLVVMATHGYSGIFRLFLGSTAEKVAQYVGKPVLTLRPSKNLYKKEK